MTDLVKEFDKLMSHLNGEENSMAEEFREMLVAVVGERKDAN